MGAMVMVDGAGVQNDAQRNGECNGHRGGLAPNVRAKQLLEQAKTLEKRGHASGATALCLEALELIENNAVKKEGNQLLLAECYSRLGACAVATKKVTDALYYFHEAVKLNPEDAESMHAYATLLNETSPTRAREAVEWLRAAINVSPDFTEAKRTLAMILTDIGVRLKHAGLPSDAFQMYMDALAVDPTYAQACYNLGVAYADMGMKKEALEFYAKALERNPLHAEALCNAGVIQKENGNVEIAISNYERALSINPNFVLARSNLAIALCDAGTQAKQLGNRVESFRLYKKALAHNAFYADAHYNLGVAYAEDRKLQRAVVHYELAVKFNPNHTEAHNNLGVVYKDLGNLERSLDSYKAALIADHNNHQTHNNIAVVYTLTGNVDLAAKHLETAILIAPKYAEAHNNIGVLLRDEGDVERAIQHYEICCGSDPKGEMGRQNRLHALNYSESFTPEQIYEEHWKWGAQFEERMRKELVAARIEDELRDRILKNAAKKPDQTARGVRSPLRVGYLSPDFFTHSVSYFAEALLAQHSEELGVFVYSNVQKEDQKTSRLRAYPCVEGHWREVTSLSTIETVNLIMEDKIDILVELAGHTNGNRLDVMALRAAPVQVTWIGYPNTTGLSTIDYRVTDGVVDPVETTQQFSEKLWRLPDIFLCYTPAVDAPEDVAPPPMASSGGIVTLGSFNILAKMQPRTVKLWGRILRTIPKSRLLLKAKPFASVSTQKRVQEGIDESRLDLFPLIPTTRSHLEAYSNVDVALDPFPYAGTTTTCEALYMGVPVVTLATGDDKLFHPHNVGVTLLKAIGHEELIARNEDEYVEKVVALTSNAGELTHLRQKLRGDMMNSPLGQAREFARHVEDMYYAMWEEKGGVVDRSSRNDPLRTKP